MVDLLGVEGNGDAFHWDAETKLSDNDRHEPHSDQSIIEKIKEQLEFYFGEANYPKDKWMKSTASENGGYIPISKLLNFPRLAKLIEGRNASTLLTQAIELSPDLTFDDNKEMVKRTTPLPDIVNLDERSILVKKLPKDHVEIEAVKALFEGIASPIMVRVLTKKDKTPTGAAIVAFKTMEDKEKTLDAEIYWPESKSRLELVDKKIADINFQQLRKAKNKRSHADSEAFKDKEWKKGVILKLKVLSSISASDLSELFAPFGKIKYVDHKVAENAGGSAEVDFDTTAECWTYIRFSEPESAQAALSSLEKDLLVFKDYTIRGHLLSGEEEEGYWSENIIRKSGPKKKTRAHHRKHTQQQQQQQQQ